MIAVALAGLLVTATGVIVGWRLLGDVRDASGESLTVTLDALDSVEDTIDLSERGLEAIGSTVTATRSTLASVDQSLAAGTDVIGEVTALTDAIGPSLDDVARTLRQLEGVGSSIDSLLGDLSRVPFGPDYDPAQPLGETFGALADTVEDLPQQFASTSTDLGDFERSLVDISADVDALTGAIGEVRTELDQAEALIAGYRRNLESARTVASDTRGDLDTDVRLMRIVLVIGGITIAFGQIVPFWLGRQLLGRRGDIDDVLGSPTNA
jgi:ABC-type transporter Mla subunit MlaD